MNPKQDPDQKKPGFFAKILLFLIGKGLRLRTYPYVFKKIGYWTAFIMMGLVLLNWILFVSNIIHVHLIAILSPLPEIIFVLSIYFIMSSKDKFEDDMNVEDRRLAYQLTVTVMLLAVIMHLIREKIFGPSKPDDYDFTLLSFVFVYLVTLPLLKFYRKYI